MNPETKLEAEFVKKVRRAAGGRAFKLLPTVAGIPDRLVVFPGGALYLVELKTATGKLSPIQEHWHAQLAEMGVTVHTLYGMADVNRWLMWAANESWIQHRAQDEIRKQADKLLRSKKLAD